MNEQPLSNKMFIWKSLQIQKRTKTQTTNKAYLWHRTGKRALENPWWQQAQESWICRSTLTHPPPTQPQTEFLLFVFNAVSLVPPSGCLGLRGNPLYLHSVPHVLVVVLTVKIQDSLPTPSCRQLFISSMWVSNIWTANPAVEGWMNEEDGNAVLSGNKAEVKIHQEHLQNAVSAPPGVTIVPAAVSFSTT